MAENESGFAVPGADEPGAEVPGTQEPGTLGRRAADWTQGSPVGHHGVYTPMGEIEQIGKMAAGLAGPPGSTGWRRAAARVFILAVVLFIVGALLAGAISAF